MAATACTEANILRELGEITNPYNFGLQLGINSKVLDQIDRDHRNDVERQRSEIIKYWDRNTEESERTWGSLADAIGKLGGHRNLETKLRQLGTTPTGPGTKLRIPTTPGAASSPMAFSDALSPTELVSWLSQQFQAKGLTLDPSLGQKLIDDDINGEAFMDLKESNLVEMGFTKLGQRMKIVKIIQSIKGSKEENGSSQNEAASKPVQAEKTTSGAPGHASGSKGSGAGDLSLSLKRSTESDVLQKFYAELNSSITDPDQFAAELIQHKFTTKQTADNKMPLGVSNYRKVGNLLGIVDSHIRSVSSVSPERVKEEFITLLLILRNKLGLHDLAQQMETDCYGTQQAHPASSEALSSLNENEIGVVDVTQVERKRSLRSAGRGSESASKRITNCGLNDKPSMDQLLNFKDGTSKINIPQRIGIKYSNFGTQLLRGDFGYIRSLEQQYSRDSEKINTVVLEEWLGGKGKEPKSWDTLVEVLNDIELGELARQIKESIMQSSNED